MGKNYIMIYSHGRMLPLKVISILTCNYLSEGSSITFSQTEETVETVDAFNKFFSESRFAVTHYSFQRIIQFV